jgi:hypothetical protein
MIKIEKGSTIKINEISYAGKNSNLDCRFTKLITDDQTKRNFPNQSDIKLLLTFVDLSAYFNKI